MVYYGVPSTNQFFFLLDEEEDDCEDDIRYYDSVDFGNKGGLVQGEVKGVEDVDDIQLGIQAFRDSESDPSSLLIDKIHLECETEGVGEFEG
ncbi:MAG: hypothetical protein EZS28_032746 [Streblomastix strix]|uniref:Uncharacterized protein n=1 Tax=Streblomastix strix TaxID=222440 RepID=A0A5J4UM55_9EUKA|nr:MAG: hypothetical protein EZS28_032746 [Streblomastix strix]